MQTEKCVPHVCQVCEGAVSMYSIGLLNFTFVDTPEYIELHSKDVQQLDHISGQSVLYSSLPNIGKPMIKCKKLD